MSLNEKHWSNETETIRLINDVLLPYIEKVKAEKVFPEAQKSLLVWDAFKGQSTPEVMGTLSSFGIEMVMAPKNMTHLLQPLDLTTNASFKKFEKCAFSEYFTSSIMEAPQTDPARDVTTVKVDLRLSTLKPHHARVMRDVYNYLRSEKGKDIIKAGWKAAGISDAVKTFGETKKNIELNPFA